MVFDVDRAFSIEGSPTREAPSDVEIFQSYELLGWGNKPRLSRARYVFSGLDDLDLEVRFYRYWRDYDERIVLQNLETGKYCQVKASKRGNDVHSWRLKERFAWLRHSFPNVEFFDDKNFKTDSEVTTRALWISLTHDRKIESTRAEAWRNVGKHWDNHMRALRHKYGRISTLRVWHGYDSDGFPQPHAILLFHDHEFRVFQHYNQKGDLEFCVHEKDEIARLWHSFIDVKAIHSTKALLTYVTKYQFSQIAGGSDEQLMSQLYLHGKRSFSVSGDFREKLSEFIGQLHNSACRDEAILVGEDRLQGKEPLTSSYSKVPSLFNVEKKVRPPKWRFIGIFARKKLEEIEGCLLKSWSGELKNFQKSDEVSEYEMWLSDHSFDREVFHKKAFA